MATIDTYTSPAGLDYELSRIARAVNINLDGYSFTAMVQEREPGNWYVHFGTEGLEQYGAENKTCTSMGRWGVLRGGYAAESTSGKAG